MQYAHLNLRVPVDFKERVIEHRLESGIPTAVYVRRLVEADLDLRQPDPKRRKAERKAG